MAEEHDISRTQREMAKMSLDSRTDEEIAEKLRMTAAELGEEWEALREEVQAATRQEAVEIIIAQIIREAREALKDEQRQLALVISARQGRAVLTFDINGAITGVSRHSEELLGLPAENLMRKPIDLFLKGRAKGVEQTSEELRRAEAGEHVESVRTHSRPDGTTFEAEHYIIAIVGPGGYVSGFVREIQDVTKRRVHELRIAELNASIALLVER